MLQTPDVFIIGGGIIGLTTALRLRQIGLHVSLCDRGEFGKAASWAGAGILPPGDPERATTPIDKLRAMGAVQFPDFSEQLRRLTNISNGYRRNGGIEILSEEDADIVPLWEAEGIRFERVNLSEKEPQIKTSQGSAYWLPEMAQVRNPWHLRALIAACQRSGVELLPNAGVEGWARDSARITGVQFSSGETRFAKQFLVCAGPWSERLLADLNCRPGVFPVRGQILLLRSSAAVLSHTLILGKRYLVPRGDGRVLVGSTEEPEAGFVNETTESALATLREFANELVPPLREATVEGGWAGLRPGSPDGLPLIGTVTGFENVVAAVGHFRAGVQLSLGTAQLVTELVCHRETCVPPTAFALERVPDTRVRPTFRS